MQGDEFAHLVKQAAQQQTQDIGKPFAFGHIASYDPTTGRCRAIVPSLMGEDGTPVLTPWMKLGTSFSGSGYGFQACPKGGASFANPTSGEQIMICIVDGESGTALAGVMLFDQNSQPPFPNMAPGECGMKAASGSFVYMHEDNSIEINTTQSNGDVAINAGSGDVNVTTTGKATINASECDLPENTKITGDLLISGNLKLGGTIQSDTGGQYAGDLATAGEIISKVGPNQVALSTHTTEGVQTGGGTSGPPTPGT